MFVNVVIIKYVEKVTKIGGHDKLFIIVLSPTHFARAHDFFDVLEIGQIDKHMCGTHFASFYSKVVS